MCIIVFCREGIEIPDTDILRQCYQANPDGIGYMFRTDKRKISIRKGFFSFEEFLGDIEKIDKKYDLTRHDLVMHFRIATSGAIDAGACHPFPVTSRVQDLRARYISADAAIVHNGIISTLSKRGSTLSDTMYYAKKLHAEGIDNTLKTWKNWDGRLIVMTRNETIIEGSFVRDSGVLYSNCTYLPDKMSSVYNQYSALYDGDEYLSQEGIDVLCKGFCDDCAIADLCDIEGDFTKKIMDYNY